MSAAPARAFARPFPHLRAPLPARSCASTASGAHSASNTLPFSLKLSLWRVGCSLKFHSAYQSVNTRLHEV